MSATDATPFRPLIPVGLWSGGCERDRLRVTAGLTYLYKDCARGYRILEDDCRGVSVEFRGGPEGERLMAMTARSQATRVLRAGIVGCGRVAGYHARFIQAQPGAELAAVADVDESRARRFGAHYGVGAAFASLEQMLAEAHLDVLHVLSPPHLHVVQALAAVDRGVHVLVEKPLALDQTEGERLLERASQQGVVVCPDFIHLFHPCVQKARNLIASGRLGRVVHCDCFMGIDLNIAELRESASLHWSYELPGGVLHNYITHALYLTLCWTGGFRQVHAIPKMFGSQPQDLTDHVDFVLAGDEGAATAHVTVSLVTRPFPYTVRIYCERGTVQIDIDRLTLAVDAPSVLPRTLSRVMGSVSQGWQLAACAAENIVDRLRGKLVPYQGLRTLIGLLYQSIREGGSCPVPPDLARAVGRAERAVLAQAGKVHVDLTQRTCRQPGIRRAERVLVTGASGYLGREVVRCLVARGYSVRALVRPLSHIKELEALGVEIQFGDLRNREAVLGAATGVHVIVHLGAALRGSAEFMHATAIGGTANVADGAKTAGVGHVIYVSSMAVYDFLALRDGDIISSDSPLEPAPQERGKASAAKCEAEAIALEQLRRGSPSWTILRPSVFFGNGHDPKGLVGFACGRWLLCASRRGRRLRLVHVKDVARAILLAIETPRAKGKVYTVSHPETVTLHEYIQQCVRPHRRNGARVIYVPYVIAYGAMLAFKVLARLAGRTAGINRRRLAYLYRDVLVDASSIRQDLDWAPENSLHDELETETLQCGELKSVVV